LCDGGSHVDGKDDSRRSGIADVVMGNEEWEQNGDGTLIDVGCRMGEDQQAYRS